MSIVSVSRNVNLLFENIDYNCRLTRYDGRENTFNAGGMVAAMAVVSTVHTTAQLPYALCTGRQFTKLFTSVVTEKSVRYTIQFQVELDKLASIVRFIVITTD